MTSVSPSRRWQPRILLAETGVLLALALIVLLIFTPLMIAFAIDNPNLTFLDHIVHRGFAQQLDATGQLPTPHFLFHLLLIGLHTVTGRVDWQLATAFAMILPQVLLVGISYALFRVSLPPLTGWRVWAARALCAALAVGLMLIVPNYVFQFRDGYNALGFYLLGYITPTTHHNPTQTLLRPLALMLFMAVSAAALGTNRRSLGRTLAITAGIAALVVLTGTAKPSYLLALLPALAVWSAWRLIARRELPFLHRIAWLPVAIGVGGVGVALLIAQYAFTFTQTSTMGESSIIFAPLEMFTVYFEHSPGRLLYYAVMSLLLPALIYALHWRTARRDAAFNFAWLGLAFGAAFMYLLSETGERTGHGNFLWTGYIANFIVHFAAFRHALRAWGERTGARRLDVRAGITGVLLIGYGLLGTAFLSTFTAWFRTMLVTTTP